MALDAEYLKSIGLDDESVAQKIIDAATESESGLLAKRDELLNKVTTYREQLSQYDGVDLDEYSKMKAQLAKLDEQNLMDKGEFETLLERARSEHADELAAARSKVDELMGQIDQGLLDTAAAAAINEHDGIAKVLMPIIRASTRVVDDNGKRVVEVVGEDGKRMLNAKGEPITVAEFVASLKSDDDYAGSFRASGLSGGGASSNRSNGASGSDSKLFGAAKMRAARQAG